jgi:uncharacterized protein
MATIKKYAKRLRIYVGETDHYEKIVKKAKELDMAGATVFRGIMGYGENNRKIRTTGLVELSCDLPIIIEIVDSEEYIDKFLPYLDDLIQKGMITIDNVEIIKYGNKLPNHE